MHSVPCSQIRNMLLQVDHIGIAVADLDAANALYTTLLGVQPYKAEEVASEGVMTSFFKTGETKIELLGATRPDSPIAKYLEKKGQGLHHIAFEVADIYAEMARLGAEGFQLLQTEPKLGADNKLICFIHPKSAGGVLIELCQSVIVP
jgi:methylmalonyl-CoA/ethylmalonyl-CoA epimerase